MDDMQPAIYVLCRLKSARLRILVLFIFEKFLHLDDDSGEKRKPARTSQHIFNE